MKIHILYIFQDNPWGGGNQFLKALKNQFMLNGVYCLNPADADIILFNSHHQIRSILKLKKKHSDKIFIHRLDGPIFKLRGSYFFLDEFIFQINQSVSHGTVFQSDWSKKNCLLSGLKMPPYSTVIHNAPDPQIFHIINKANLSNRKRKIVAVSWSNNHRKGFDIYSYLDKNLDFSMYEMKFIGNTPIAFINIKHIPPLPSNELAEELHKSDLYLTASIDDPCSNALIEAIHTGLPVLARHSGGHVELVKGYGTTFDGETDVIMKIEQVFQTEFIFTPKNAPDKIDVVAENYYLFCSKVYDNKNELITQYNQWNYYQDLWKYGVCKFQEKLTQYR